MAPSSAARSASRPPTSSSASICAPPMASMRSASRRRRALDRRRRQPRHPADDRAADRAARGLSVRLSRRSLRPRDRGRAGRLPAARMEARRPRRAEPADRRPIAPRRGAARRARPCPTSPARDYRDTVFLPKTDFPMKAGLGRGRAGLARRWAAEDLRRAARAARGARALHPPRRPALRQRRHPHRPCDEQDPQGPHRPQPVAAGQGRAVRPGLGLPRPADRVEGRGSSIARRSSTRTTVPPAEFRAECRAYAQHWVDAPAAQFKRLGVRATGTIRI